MRAKFFLLLLVLAALPFSVANAAQPVAVATVTDFSLGEGSHVDISVLIDNPTSVALDLRYRLELVATDEKTAGRIADKSPIQSVKVAPRSNAAEKISYTAPPFVDGEYDLFVTVQSATGFPVTSALVGRTSFVGRSLPISLESCRIFAPQQGIAILAMGSIPVVTCELKNTTDEPQWVRLAGEWTRWGQSAGEGSTVSSDVTLDPKEKQEFALAFPVIERAGQYEGSIYLETGAERVSRAVSVMAQVPGDGGLVQSVALDQDSYTKGDTAIVTAYILTTKAFDASGSGLSGSMVTATLSDGSGQSCAAPMSHALETGVEQWSIPVESRCVDPKVTVKLASADGTALDEQSVAVTTPSRKALGSSLPTSKALMALIIGILLLVGLAVYLISRAKRQSGGALRSFVYGVLVMGSTLLIPSSASATTLSGSVSYTFDVFGCSISLCGGTSNWGISGLGNSLDFRTTDFNLWKGRILMSGPISVSGSIGTAGSSEFRIVGNGTTVDFSLPGSSARSLTLTGGTASGVVDCWSTPTTGPGVWDTWTFTGLGNRLNVTCNNGPGGSIVFTDTVPPPPPPVFVCTGATPANASIYVGDDALLSANTPKSYSATNTAPKCQFVCSGGFTWNGSACQPIAGPVNGVCGAANGGSTPTAPVAPNLCAPGTATSVSAGVIPPSTATFEWFCLGSGGGASATCRSYQSAAALPSTTFTGTYVSQVNQTVLNLPAGGGNVTLNWSTVNAAGGFCTASIGQPLTAPDILGWKPTASDRPINGSQTVTVSATTRFDLICRNSSGTTGLARSVTVTVPPAGVITSYAICPILGLSLDHVSTLSGQLSLYSRSDGTVPNCAAPTAVGTSDLTTLPTTTWATPGGIVTIGNGATGGRVDVVAGVSGPTTVTATIGGVVVGSAPVSVAAVPPPVRTVDLKINGSDGPVDLLSGQAKNISWNVLNATTCTATDGWSGNKSVPSGSDPQLATVTSNHTLTCYNGAGDSASDSVWVNVACVPTTGAYGACDCATETKSRTNVNALCLPVIETTACSSAEKTACRDFNWKEVAQ